MRRSASELICELERRIARLEKSARGSINIKVPTDYGYEFETISLKDFAGLVKGARFEFKDYGEGITITTKAYIDWSSNPDDDSRFEGTGKFDVQLYDVCYAFLTSVGAKEA
jgi:hypothetical protein